MKLFWKWMESRHQIQKVASNKLNETFSSVALNLADAIPQSNIYPLSYISRQQNSFFFFTMEVNKTIKGFKSKKSSLNSILSFAFKHIADIISPTLASKINESVKKEFSSNTSKWLYMNLPKNSCWKLQTNFNIAFHEQSN